jgi:UDP-N-acetylmuramoyl-tripeptide--D-alanyl-D-alanine ligase
MPFYIIFIFIPFIAFLFFLVFIKKLLFWVYLWQLKEYHIGRFIDHFRTEKGKRLIFNPINLIEFILILFFIIYLFLVPSFKLSYVFIWYVFVILIFLFQGGKFFSDIAKKNLKSPVLTKKTGLILSLGLILSGGIIFLLFNIFRYGSSHILFLFLLLDFFSPLIFSGLILLLEPISIFWRWQTIEKAKEKREKFKDLLVIGITGSYGKTSTKEFLATILSEKFRVLKTKEHQNSEMGISQCILNNLNEEHQIFVVEMGAYNRGGIKLLCDITKPKIGVLTGINEQHMATFGSQENIIKTKYELIESLPKDGTAFFNAKNKFCLELYQQAKIKKFLYGENSSFLGEENILGAVAVAKELGMSEQEISRAEEKIKNKFPGIQIKKGINGLNIIDATFSANPDGVISHLEYLKTWQGRKIIIMPCLIELGRVLKEIHQRIGEKIGEACDLAIITTKDSSAFSGIKKGAIEKGMPEENILFMENPKEIFEKIKSFSKTDDVILLESRVPVLLIKQLTINS